MPSPPTPSSPGGAEKESASDKTKASVLSQRLGIDPLDLVGWNENLRVWLTQTVLRPLVKEIDSANAALPKQGVADCQIGQVAVERLSEVSRALLNQLPGDCVHYLTGSSSKFSLFTCDVASSWTGEGRVDSQAL